MEYDGLITKPTLEELYHHGVKGQKWGVRNGPPYPLSSKISTGKALKKSAKSGSGKVGKSGGSSKKSTSALTKLADKERENGIIIPVGLLAYVGVYALAALGIGAGAVGQKISYKHTKKKISKLREKETIDPKTGLHLKNEPSTEKEDLKNTNPERKNLDNTEGSGKNCTFCTTAYDIRRRGYDVHAGTTIRGYTNSQIASWYKNGKFTTIKQTTDTLVDRKTAVNHIRDTIIKKSGEGSRGNITVSWSGTFSGHSMIYEVKDGKLILMDGQTNQIYKDTDFIFNRVNTTDVAFMRTDNLTPNYAVLKKMGVIK